MIRVEKTILAAAVMFAITGFHAEAATDAERINALEDQLKQQKAVMEQQQRLLESMDAKLQELRTAESTATTSVVADSGKQPAPGTADQLSAKGTKPLSISVYGFAQADAINDFTL